MHLIHKEVNELANKKLSAAKLKQLKEQAIELKKRPLFDELQFYLAAMLSEQVISWDEYNDIYERHFNNNPYLDAYAISAPRIFGEEWAEKRIVDNSENIIKASVKNTEGFSGEFDLRLGGIKIEVKASRATRTGKELLHIRALSEDDSDKWSMNFQQLKPNYCDVFIFSATWTDSVRYWVFSSEEIKNHPLYKPQHRDAGAMGQFCITKANENLFEENECSLENLEERIKKVSSRKFEAPRVEDLPLFRLMAEAS